MDPASPSPPLGFAASGLTRHASERGEDALERALLEPGALSVVFCGEEPVLASRNAPGGAAATALHEAEIRRGRAFLEDVFLGHWGGAPVLASRLPPEAAASFAALPGLSVSDLRSVAAGGLVAHEELGMLAQAKSLLSWHARHGFCAQCGAPTRAASSGYRRDCAGCGAQHFPRTDPVVIMLVAHGDRCLLGRQARFAPGVYSCLAGFVEPGETIEDAVRRETYEEAGVRVGTVHYALSQPWPFPSSLMIGCIAQAMGVELTLDREELEDARWFERDELRAMLAQAHPKGLQVPPPLAIAHHLVRRFALQES